MILLSRRILVTGGHGFLGRYVCRKLTARGAAVSAPRSTEFDLRDPVSVEAMFAAHQPEVVVHLASRVGGIGANRERPGEFFYDNMAMGLHVIEQARRSGVSKFVQLGTICAYPKHTPVPFPESELWSGYPEETNAPYGIAKKALLVMLQSYRQQYGFPGIYLLPVNLYGPGDNFDPKSSHVIPALIRKFAEAMDQTPHAPVTVWGTGKASREFLYVEDCAEAIVLATENYDGAEPVNVGTGKEITIRDLVGQIGATMGYQGTVEWDADKPDGQPRRCLDVSRARQLFGFTAQTTFEVGLARTIDWYRTQRATEQS